MLADIHQVQPRRDAFAEYLTGLGLSGTTIVYYVRHAETADAWLRLHSSSLRRASAVDIAAYSQTLTNSHSTKGQAAAAMQRYWEWIGRTDGPRRALRVPPAPEMVCLALEPEEATRMRDLSLGWWPEGAATLMGLYLGARRTEIAVAEWQRFNQDMTWYRITGKNQRTRTLPVHPVLRVELERRRRPAGYLFGGRFDGHANPATIWQWTLMVARKAGVSDFSTHRLRHTALAVGNDNTRDLRSVQAFAGHVRSQTTSGYTRATAKNLQAVVAALDYDERPPVEAG